MKKYLLAVVFLCLSILSYSNDTEALDQDTNTGIITQAKDFAKVKGKSKKQIFIDTLIPTIEKIRTKIAEDKEYVKTLIEKEILTAEEKLYLGEKGGDPAAPSDTATLFRLHPNHLSHLRRLAPKRLPHRLRVLQTLVV